jgi:hypothetical protein
MILVAHTRTGCVSLQRHQVGIPDMRAAYDVRERSRSMAPEEQTTPRNVTPDPILQLAMGYMASKHVFVANEIGLFQHLAAGPATLDALAQRTGVPRRTVQLSTDAMVALGLVERHGDQYQNGFPGASEK